MRYALKLFNVDFGLYRFMEPDGDTIAYYGVVSNNEDVLKSGELHISFDTGYYSVYNEDQDEIQGGDFFSLLSLIKRAN